MQQNLHLIYYMQQTYMIRLTVFHATFMSSGVIIEMSAWANYVIRPPVAAHLYSTFYECE